MLVQIELNGRGTIDGVVDGGTLEQTIAKAVEETILFYCDMDYQIPTVTALTTWDANDDEVDLMPQFGAPVQRDIEEAITSIQLQEHRSVNR